MALAFFDIFSLLLGAAFLILGCRRQYVGDMARYQKALSLFLWSLVLFYPVSSIFMIGVYLGFVAHPLGMILSVLSFRHLCLALIFHAVDARPEKPSLE